MDDPQAKAQDEGAKECASASGSDNLGPRGYSRMSDIAFLPATELLKLYRGRELSPVEATEAALRQIELYNPRVNSYCLVDAEQALAQARESEERYLTGTYRGRLDGVPASIKDLILTRGWSTLRGSSSGQN